MTFKKYAVTALGTPLLATALCVIGLVGNTAHAGPWAALPTCLNELVCVPTLGVPYGPVVHPGKEYMWEANRDFAGNPAPGQVVAWDGASGVANSSINHGSVQVDALANHGDAYYKEVITNKTALLFSDRSNDVWGRASDTVFPIYFETAGGAVGGWATRQQVNQHWNALESQGHKLNLVGLEVWGTNSPGGDDSDMYSVHGDNALVAGGVAYSVLNMGGTGYIARSALAQILGLSTVEDLVDLDAMMVQDNGNLEWDSGDSILFSLMPIAGQNGFTVGDAAYVWNFDTGVSLLNHGGHAWSNGWRGVNVDALESAVPEPTSIALLGLGLLGLFGTRRRRSQ